MRDDQFIPTSHLRLVRSPRNDAEPPRLQQLWLRVIFGVRLHTLERAACLDPTKADGEWRDVPMAVVEAA